MKLNDIPLIPRSTLFGNPERGGCQVSPCGRWLAFAAPHNGVMNLWVCDVVSDRKASIDTARPVTDDRNRGVYLFTWAFDGVHLLFMQDKDGDENDHVFAVSVIDGVTRDLTPFAGARAGIQQGSRKIPGDVLVTINNRDPRFADLYRVELATGALTLVQENPGYFGFICDDDFQLRLALSPQADGSRAVMKRDGDGWKVWRTIAELDSNNTWPQGLNKDGHTLYMFDSRDRDTAALIAYDLESDGSAGIVIAEHAGADISGVWEDPDTHAPIAWTATFERREVHVLDDRIRKEVEFLNEQGLGEWGVINRDDAEALWVIAAATDISPASYYLFDRVETRLTKLYDARPALVGAPLARMQHTMLRSRDGLGLVSYLTLPVYADVRDKPFTSSEPLPLILLVHGGPQTRDSWGYNGSHQWLANRGYAVLAVNYRASTGFGKAFTAAGDREWGAKMDDDLVDAIQWAIDCGIADRSKICIMGASYGGYATLWSMTANPDLYACGVDIVGPSNLETLASSIPAYWAAAKTQLFRMIGNAETEEGRALMQARSPVHRSGLIRRPLLIGQGANDPRVKQAESDQMVAAMKANDVPVTYVLFPDEGHGFLRPANNIRFNAMTEQFLAKYLGGRYEPESVEEVEGNTAVIVEDSLA